MKRFKVAVGMLSDGRVLIVGDTGQSDHDNFCELKDLCDNIVHYHNDSDLKESFIGFREIELDV
jgi:hypothetical protein